MGFGPVPREFPFYGAQPPAAGRREDQKRPCCFKYGALDARINRRMAQRSKKAFEGKSCDLPGIRVRGSQTTVSTNDTTPRYDEANAKTGLAAQPSTSSTSI